MAVTNTEKILNRVSSIALVIGGAFFIYEGALLVDMHRSNPSKVPKKIAVAGALTIFLGVLSLAFVILHLIFDGTLKEFSDSLKIPVKNASGTRPANAATGANAGTRLNVATGANAGPRLNAATGANAGPRLNAATGANAGPRPNAAGISNPSKV